MASFLLPGEFLTAQAAYQIMREHGHGGSIINTASMTSFSGGFTVPAYTASKGGIAQLTKAFCNEWASQGINVNAIAPGYIETDMTASLKEELKREYLEKIPAKRFGSVDDIAAAVLFLASDLAAYITGEVIRVDGGLCM